MKTSICIGIVLALFAGNASAGCDLSQKTLAFQQELQKVAINNPEKMDSIGDELDRYSEEFSKIAEEQSNDPQRMDRLCAKLDEMVKLLQ